MNKCGKSEPIIVTVPAATNCKDLPRVVKSGTDGINPNDVLIFANLLTKTIKVISDILYTAPFDARLYDMTGRLVHQQSFETIDITIDYSGKELQSGFYIFNLSSGEKPIKTTRFHYETY